MTQIGRRFAALAALLFTLAACGGSNAPAAQTDVGITSNSILLGSTIALSGAAAAYGTIANQGTVTADVSGGLISLSNGAVTNALCSATNRTYFPLSTLRAGLSCVHDPHHDPELEYEIRRRELERHRRCEARAPADHRSSSDRP